MGFQMLEVCLPLMDQPGPEALGRRARAHRGRPAGGASPPGPTALSSETAAAPIGRGMPRCRARSPGPVLKHTKSVGEAAGKCDTVTPSFRVGWPRRPAPGAPSQPAQAARRLRAANGGPVADPERWAGSGGPSTAACPAVLGWARGPELKC